MKHVLLLLGGLVGYSSLAQTGTVKDFTKISQTSGNLNTALINQGHFGFVSAVGPQQIISAAPHNGNGEIFFLSLSATGEVISETRIAADDYALFADVIDAAFGTSSINLGDINLDGQNDFLIGTPGFTAFGGLILLKSDGAGFTVDSVSIPAAYQISDAGWGKHLHKNGDELMAGLAHGSGKVISFLINESTIDIQHIYDDSDPNLAPMLASGDRFGTGITTADVDGDGISDLISGAPGDDSGGTDFGAVYINFRNSDMTIREVKRIATSQSNFLGFLNTADEFGISITSLGDLDQDGVPDIAVGAPGDDDGNIDIGAVWILFLRDTGTVKGFQKISRLAGDFGGDINYDDRFGTRVTAVGDIDGDGSTDIAVGAVRDDDGGTDRGAVYIINLDYCATPTAMFDHEHNGSSVSFSIPGGEGYEFLWNFDDGFYSQSQNPTHTYASSGTYSVCLNVISPCGGNYFCQSVSVTATVTSTRDQTNQNTRVYPNPAKSEIRIDSPHLMHRIRIHDLTGKMVLDESGSRHHSKVDLNDFRPGLYLLEITTETGRTVHKIQVL